MLTSLENLKLRSKTIQTSYTTWRDEKKKEKKR